MRRFAEETLHRWLQASRRKPLVLRGARQVGKTTLVRQFAAAAGLGLCEVNLERERGDRRRASSQTPSAGHSMRAV